MEGSMRWFLALSAALVLAACDPAVSPAANQQGDRVRETEQAMITAIAAEDAAAVAGTYAPDAQMMIPFSAPLTTPDAIRADYQRIFDDPNGALTLTPTEVIMTSAGDYAFSQGTFSLGYTDPGTQQAGTVAGHYVLIWRRQDDDSWKIMRDIATPGPARAPAAPATP
jgi:uncharacterized protein (TIGR02246 family)